MIDQKPSLTAYAVAVMRAAHQVIGEPVVFHDPVALRILGNGGEAAVQAHLADAARYAGLRARVAERSRIAEDMLAEAAARGVRQYVLLGAGLDSFGVRGLLPDVHVFEVDHPATQAWKRAKLAEAGFDVPARLRFVPMDFERQDLRTALIEGGFLASEPAVFAMLGVAIYVARESLMDTWSMIAALGPGRVLVFDYAEDFRGAPAEARAAQEALGARVAAIGEPFRTWFDPAELARDLRGLGFAEVRDIRTSGAFSHVIVAWT
jgi:methyltransferase (TIGR00027 family)